MKSPTRIRRAAGTLLFLAITAAAVSSCARQPREEKPVSMDQVRADLLTMAESRVFFGHHSVGNNILKGIRTLADRAGVPLRIEEVAIGHPAPQGPGLFHAKVGENLDPDAKIAGFAQALGAANEAPYDVATFKFCYVDLDEGSKERSPDKLFTRYSSEMSAIETAHPGVSILHATMPLMAEPPGRKTRLKRLLGLSTVTDAANLDRGEFNQRVRDRYAGDKLLDVARFEATRPDGTVAGFPVGGREVEMLVLDYTSDGGHLNALGQERVAADFIHSIAEALRHRGAVQSPALTTPSP